MDLERAVCGREREHQISRSSNHPTATTYSISISILISISFPVSPQADAPHHLAKLELSRCGLEMLDLAAQMSLEIHCTKATKYKAPVGEGGENREKKRSQISQAKLIWHGKWVGSESELGINMLAFSTLFH